MRRLDDYIDRMSAILMAIMLTMAAMGMLGAAVWFIYALISGQVL